MATQADVLAYWQKQGRTVRFIPYPAWYMDPATLAQVAAASGKTDGVPTRAASEAHGIPQPMDWIGDRPHYGADLLPSGTEVWVYDINAPEMYGGTNVPLPPFAIAGGGSLMVYTGSGNAPTTATAATTTTATKVTAPIQTSVSAALADAQARLQQSIKTEIATLTQSLGPATALYKSANDALTAAIANVVQQETARLNAITDPSQVQTAEAQAEQHIDAVAQQAYQTWLATTSGHPAIDSVTQQTHILVSATGAAQQAGASGGPVASAGPAIGASLDLSSVPQQDPNSTVSWFNSVRQRFLAAPAELRADLDQADQLTALVPDASALTGLPGVEQTLQSLQQDWASDAVSYQQVADAIDAGQVTAATVVQIVGLAAVIAAFFARKAAAESALDSIGHDTLTPEQYAQWTKHPAGGSGGNGLALLAFAAIGVWWATHPPRPKRNGEP